MFRQYCFYLFLKFIVLFDKFSNANPLSGENVQLARKGEFPFIVSLSRTYKIVRKYNHFCGGTLISKKHVLTSAHCVKHPDLSDISAIVGTLDFESGRIYNVETKITYDEWAAENNIVPNYMDNDLAIITLSQNVEDAVPAVISKLIRHQVIGKKVVTAGWGYTDEFLRSRPKSLQKAYLKVVSTKIFHQNELGMFNRTITMPVNAYFTSANPPAVTTCGDSGGPLLLESNNELVGIIDSSCNIDDPRKNRYAMSVHLTVDYYRAFIESVIKNK